MYTQHYQYTCTGAYTGENLMDLICETKTIVHPLILDQSLYPRQNIAYISNVELQEKIHKSKRRICRLGNLYEIVAFIKYDPRLLKNLILEHGPIEGFDPYLEKLGIGKPNACTRPYITFSGNRLEVGLAPQFGKNDCGLRLIVVHEKFEDTLD